jgi:tRNA uracil 4-sulfurtransferase
MTEKVIIAGQHQKIYLARIGEISLKGLNRGAFERRLLDNLKRRLRPLGLFLVDMAQSRIWIIPGEVQPLDEASRNQQILQAITSVFGIVSASPVWRFPGGLQEMETQAAAFAGEILRDGQPRTFKVESRRGNKQFPFHSPEISSRIGEVLIEAFPDQLKVDVHQPDFVLYVEVRDQICLYSEIIKGQKGLPVGTGGLGLLLLSGGIDSPVAGYMMASRGMELQALYFHAYPFTSDRARDKVEELARQLSLFSGRLKLHVVDFTEIQLTMRDNCPAELLTIVMRRMMLRIAEKLALREGCQALITGESLGQVASQTVEAIQATGSVASLPILRPLIGMDKDDTITIARRIGTFETSILPFEDCCTIFVAKHPKIHPRAAEVQAAEASLDVEALVADGLARISTMSL